MADSTDSTPPACTLFLQQQGKYFMSLFNGESRALSKREDTQTLNLMT